MVNIYLASAKSPWPRLVFTISFHHRKFPEYEKIGADIPVYHITFRFLSQHETDVDSPVCHNYIRNR